MPHHRRETCLIIATLAWCAHAAADTPAPPPSNPIPRYTISLDAAPEDRWKPVLTDPKLNAILHSAITHEYALVTSTPALKNATDAIVAAMAPNVPDAYVREMQGMARILNVTYEATLVTQLYAELVQALPDDDGNGDGARRLRALRALRDGGGAVHATGKECTSIVAQRANGTVYHARNQDYPAKFAATTIQLDFVRGNNKIYTATNFAGCVGLSGSAVRLGGARAGAWSWSINERDDPQSNTPAALARTPAAARAGGLPATFVARLAMEGAPGARGRPAARDYAEALGRLANDTLLIPQYFIVAGTTPGAGAVVTRDRFGDGHGSPTRAAVSPLGAAQPCGGRPYFVAVTNTDLWDASICTADPRDSRIANTIKLMSALGAGNVDLAALWRVLSTPPEFADDTLHTDAMVPAWGQYETRLRV